MTTVRPYQLSDRAAVRQLAFDTAEAGRPSTFSDPRLQMDLLTRYYTDHEPSSLWVLERDGRVAGYLTGCLNTKNFLAWLNRRGHLLTAFHVVVRNFYRPAIWKWVHARMRTVMEGGAHREPWVSDYPAHLHLNLAESARGQGAGTQLMAKFFEQCRAAGVTGVHLSTRADNKEAQQFFQKNGFEALATINAYRPTPAGLNMIPVIVMGRKFV